MKLSCPLAITAVWLLSAASAAQAWSIERKLEFKPGTAQMVARLKPQADADLRSLMADKFEVALVDLDDDGHAELIVTSAGACPRLGCPVQVLTLRKGRLVTLLSTTLPAGLAVTREKQDGWRALAVQDGQGGIALADTPRPGMPAKPLVATMVALAVTAPPAAAAATATAPPAALMPEPPATAARAQVGIDVLGMVLGRSSPAEARQRLQALGPAQQLQQDDAEMSFSAPGIQATVIEGSRYVEAIHYRTHLSSNNCSEEQQCEVIDLVFAQPPHNILVAVSRNTSFPPTPAATYLKALTDKYGPPSLSETRVDGSVTLTWAWQADGRLQARLDRGSVCRRNILTQTPYVPPSTAQQVNAAGCGWLLSADYAVRNDLVRGGRISALASAALVETSSATTRYVQAVGDKYLSGKRAAAAATAAPRN